MSMRSFEANSNSEDRQRLGAVVVQCQLIHAALIASSLLMTVILFGLAFSREPAEQPRDLQKNELVVGEAELSTTLAIAAAGAATLGFLASIAIPMVVRNNAVAKLGQSPHALHAAGKSVVDEANDDTSNDLGPLLQIYQTGHILGMAILESSVLLAGLTLLFGAPFWALAFPAFLILVMVLRTPRRPSVEAWVTQQQHG